jgi:hypothetical protein
VEEFNMHAVSDKQDKAQSLLNSARQNYFYWILDLSLYALFF